MVNFKPVSYGLNKPFNSIISHNLCTNVLLIYLNNLKEKLLSKNCVQKKLNENQIGHG